MTCQEQLVPFSSHILTTLCSLPQSLPYLLSMVSITTVVRPRRIPRVYHFSSAPSIACNTSSASSAVSCIVNYYNIIVLKNVEVLINQTVIIILRVILSVIDYIHIHS